MRELAKSAISLSWAMSLLGMRQAMGLFNPQGVDGTRSGARSFEAVTQAAVNQLDPSLQGTFRTGDNMQRSVMNLMFGFIDPGNWNPGRWMPGTGEGCSSNCSGQSSQGWGPMPPRPDGQ
jgi:hypothetical protein